MRCDICREDAVFYQPYSGAHLCQSHFLKSVERRAMQQVRADGFVNRCRHVAVALSGGKDSATCLYIVHSLLKQNPRVRLSALLVDEGIEGYRPLTIEAAGELCRRLGVPLEKVSFRELWGTTLDELVARGERKRACAYCGVLRRWALNRRARELGAQAVCTGHNLDDQAQTVLLNVLDDDLKRLVRLGHPVSGTGLVPRYRPLSWVPEQEVALYTLLRGIPHRDATCPYSGSSARNDVRDLLTGYEDRHPGTRHSLVRFYQNIQPLLMMGVDKTERAGAMDSAIESCETCGEPGVGKTCRACALLAELGQGRR